MRSTGNCCDDVALVVDGDKLAPDVGLRDTCAHTPQTSVRSWEGVRVCYDADKDGESDHGHL